VYLLRSVQDTDLPLTAANVIQAAAALSAAWFMILPFFGVYRSKFTVSRTDELLNIFKAVTFGAVLLYILISYDTGEVVQATRIFIVYYWLFLVFNLGLGRIVVRTLQKKLLHRGVGHRNTLIIGTGRRASEAYRQILDHPATGFDVRGFIRTSKSTGEHIPEEMIAGDMNVYQEFCTSAKIEDVIIVLDRPSNKKLFEIVDQCNGYPVSMKTIPDIYQIAVGNARIYNYFGLQLVDILPENYSLSFRFAKRCIDVLVSSLVIFTFLPLWVIIGFFVKLSSKGPVFYRQERLGKDGQVFTVYKFRSMVVDAEKLTGPTMSEKDDPRITKFGRILRLLRLDEIPQFINVLEGDMSLIGPRPERPYFVERFTHQIPLYSKRFRIKPGITGWAQVKQRYTESIRDIKKKLEYDLYYIENMSLLFDLKIMIATIFTILARRG